MASSVSPHIFEMIIFSHWRTLNLWYNSRHLTENAVLKCLTKLWLIASALHVSSVCTLIDNKNYSQSASRIRSVIVKLSLLLLFFSLSLFSGLRFARRRKSEKGICILGSDVYRCRCYTFLGKRYPGKNWIVVLSLSLIDFLIQK